MHRTPIGDALPPPLLTASAAQAPPLPPTPVQNVYVSETLPTSEMPAVIDFPLGDAESSSTKLGLGVVIGTLFIFAVVGLLIFMGVRALGNRLAPKASSEATLTPTASTTPLPATSAPPVSLATVPTVGVTIAPTTIAPTTIAPTAIASTTSALSTIPHTTVAAPEVPVSTARPVSGPGISQVLRDPMSNGVPFVDVSASFALAQQLADTLASDDWDRVRSLEPAKAQFADSQFGGYKGLDRASLILVDARPQGDGYRNLIVSVANEGNGTRTSLFCLEWSASPATGSVVEHSGVVGKLTTLDGTVSSETVVNDPALSDLMKRKCVWS